ncbi:MAG: ABC transporter ATP-binding protein [Acetivibrionales bacterium]|jgi:ABC-2 type transport system ATP-binding protein
MLSVKNLYKQYDEVVAANNISFDVQKGEIAVLLGPNGAGKSTVIKCIAGLLRYEGSISICGEHNKSLEAKRVFGYVPETPALYEMLTVQEHLEFIAHAYNLENYSEYMEKLQNRFELANIKGKLGRELSKGMQQKVSICCALLPRPKVVLFDEPMIGLDPKAIKELKNIFIELKENGCSIIISTHIIDSIEGIWDKTLIMKNGVIITSRNREELEKSQESLEQLFFHITEE